MGGSNGLFCFEEQDKGAALEYFLLLACYASYSATLASDEGDDTFDVLVVYGSEVLKVPRMGKRLMALQLKDFPDELTSI